MVEIAKTRTSLPLPGGGGRKDCIIFFFTGGEKSSGVGKKRRGDAIFGRGTLLCRRKGPKIKESFLPLL